MKTKTDRLVRWTSTAGFLSHGLIYLLIGGFALAAGITSAEEKDSAGVMRFIVSQPFGKILLCVLILGLICFVIWRMIQAFLNTEDEKWPMRVAFFAIGVTFIAITYLAIQALFGEAKSSDESAESWSSLILSFPFGRWLLGAVFLVVVAIGAYQAYYAIARTFAEDLELESYPGWARSAILWTCSIGFLTRSILILLIAAYLFRAVWFLDPDEAQGIGGALDSIHEVPFGRWLISAVGLGLMCYSVFAFTRSRHGSIGLPSEDN